MFDVPDEAVQEESHPLQFAARDLAGARPGMWVVGLLGVILSSLWMVLLVAAVYFARRGERWEALLGAVVLTLPGLLTLGAALALLRSAALLDPRRPDTLTDTLSGQVPVWVFGTIATWGFAAIFGLVLLLFLLALAIDPDLGLQSLNHAAQPSLAC